MNVSYAAMSQKKASEVFKLFAICVDKSSAVELIQSLFDLVSVPGDEQATALVIPLPLDFLDSLHLWGGEYPGFLNDHKWTS